MDTSEQKPPPDWKLVCPFPMEGAAVYETPDGRVVHLPVQHSKLTPRH